MNYEATMTTQNPNGLIITVISLLLAAFGEEHESGMQMPWSFGLLRTQDLLEIRGFFQNGKSSSLVNILSLFSQSKRVYVIKNYA